MMLCFYSLSLSLSVRYGFWCTHRARSEWKPFCQLLSVHVLSKLVMNIHASHLLLTIIHSQCHTARHLPLELKVFGQAHKQMDFYKAIPFFQLPAHKFTENSTRIQFRTYNFFFRCIFTLLPARPILRSFAMICTYIRTPLLCYL